MDDVQHPLNCIFRMLAEYIDENRIEVRFSAIHVIEIAHLERQHMDFALGRARCIQALARGKCLRVWLDVFRDECLNIVHSRPVGEGIASDNGFWYPDISEVADTLKQTLFDELEKALLETPLNRQQRRSIKRTLFPGGNLGPTGIKMLQNGRERLLEGLSREFPFGERFYREDMMLKFVAGQITAGEVVEEMSVVLRDVPTFVGWTYEERDKERKFVSWLRSYGRQLVDIVEKLRADLSANVTQYSHLEIDTKKIYDQAVDHHTKKVRTEFIRGFHNDDRKASRHRKEQADQWLELETTAIGTIPALDAYILAMGEYVRRSLQMPRKLKASDAADLWHLAYLPYSDIFRADGDSSQIGRPIAKLFGKRIVPKLDQLPDAIEHALKQR